MEKEPNWLDAASPTPHRHGKHTGSSSHLTEVSVALEKWRTVRWTPVGRDQQAWSALDWWMHHEKEHPLIAKLARRHLATQVRVAT